MAAPCSNGSGRESLWYSRLSCDSHHLSLTSVSVYTASAPTSESPGAMLSALRRRQSDALCFVADLGQPPVPLPCCRLPSATVLALGQPNPSNGLRHRVQATLRPLGSHPHFASMGLPSVRHRLFQQDKGSRSPTRHRMSYAQAAQGLPCGRKLALANSGVPGVIL